MWPSQLGRPFSFVAPHWHRTKKRRRRRSKNICPYGPQQSDRNNDASFFDKTNASKMILLHLAGQLSRYRLADGLRNIRSSSQKT